MRFPSGDDLSRMVGHRVVVRHRLPASETAGATDVIGTMISADERRLVIRPDALDDGVTIAVADVIAARAIPVRPVARRDVRDLEAAALLGWQAAEVARHGGWLLRASHGFTGRGNSVLPLADPARTLDEAVAGVETWYEDRHLRPAFQMIEPLTADLTEALDRRGWSPATDRTLVMTAPLEAMPPTPDDVTVRIDDAPDDAWLAQYHYRGGALPPKARDIIAGTGSTGPAVLAFASVRAGDRAAAIARGAVTTAPSGRGWLGITAVEVAPEQRRRGLATAVMAALADRAREHGATGAYVQVATENAGATRTYDALGFTAHHHYHYRRR